MIYSWEQNKETTKKVITAVEDPELGDKLKHKISDFVKEAKRATKEKVDYLLEPTPEEEHKSDKAQDNKQKNIEIKPDEHKETKTEEPKEEDKENKTQQNTETNKNINKMVQKQNKTEEKKEQRM